MIELWHEWNSVHSLKVRIVLAEKGADWRSRVIELLKFEHLQPEYLAVNPNGVVPPLVHNGAPIYDSSPICEYLDEFLPEPPLKPDTPLGRARMRAWMKLHDDMAHPALRNASFELLYKPALRNIDPETLAAWVGRHPRPERRQKFLDGARTDIDWESLRAAASVCIQIADHLDRALEHGLHWLLGHRFTLADVAMAPFAERIENLGLEELVWARRDRAAAWAHRVKLRPSIRMSKPPTTHRLPPPQGHTIEELSRRMSD
jgi:glutathione S-transferase